MHSRIATIHTSIQAALRAPERAVDDARVVAVRPPVRDLAAVALKLPALKFPVLKLPVLKLPVLKPLVFAALVPTVVLVRPPTVELVVPFVVPLVVELVVEFVAEFVAVLVVARVVVRGE